MSMADRGIVKYVFSREQGLTGRGRSFNLDIADNIAEEKATLPVHNLACELSGQSRSTFILTFSPDGAKIASTHGDHTVRITDIQTGQCLHTLHGHPRTPWCVAYHPSNNHILASGCLGGEVRIWDLQGGGSEVWKSDTGSVISSICFHPFDQVLVVAMGNELLFWDWTQPKPFARCKTRHDDEKIRWVKFDKWGHYIYTGITNRSGEQEAPVYMRGANENPASVPPGNAAENSGMDPSERRRLQQQYRHIVEQITSNQHSRVHFMDPHMDLHTDGALSGTSDAAHRHSGATYRHNHGGDNATFNAPSASNSSSSSFTTTVSGSTGSITIAARIGRSRPYLESLGFRSSSGLGIRSENNSIGGPASSAAGTASEDSNSSLPQNPASLQSAARAGLEQARQYAAAVSRTNMETDEGSQSEDVQSDPIVVTDEVTGASMESLESVNVLEAEPSPAHSASTSQEGAVDASQSCVKQNLPNDGTSSPTTRSRHNSHDGSLARDEDERNVERRRQNSEPTSEFIRSEGVENLMSGTAPSDSRISRALHDAIRCSLMSSSSGGSGDVPFFRPSSILRSQLGGSNSVQAGSRNIIPEVTIVSSRAITSSSVPSSTAPSSSNSMLLSHLLHGASSQSVSSSTSSTNADQSITTTAASLSNTSTAPSTMSYSTSRVAQLRRLRRARLHGNCSNGNCSICGNYAAFHEASYSARANAEMRSRSFPIAPRRVSRSSGGPFIDSNAMRGRRRTSASIRESIERVRARQLDIQETINALTRLRRRGETRISGGESPESPPRASSVSRTSAFSSTTSSGRLSAAGRRMRFRRRSSAPAINENDGNEMDSRFAEISGEIASGMRQLDDLGQSVGEITQRLSERLQNLNAQRQRDWEHIRQQRGELRRGFRNLQLRLHSLRRWYRTVSGINDPPRIVPESAASNALENQSNDINMVDSPRPGVARTREFVGFPPRVSLPQNSIHRHDPSWYGLHRRPLHSHYASSILDDALNRHSTEGMQAAINRVLAGAFMGIGESAVASNIVNLNYRIQRWDFRKYKIPNLENVETDVIVSPCKLHCDSSCDISQDGRYLAAFVPSHRGFPDDTILGVFSLEEQNLGECLYTKSFGPNAVSVSMSPLNNYILVGLAARRLAAHWLFPPKQMVAQVFKLKTKNAGEDSTEHICDILHPYELDIQRQMNVNPDFRASPHLSVNCARWLPDIGQGVVYGTNRGDLHICRPGDDQKDEKDRTQTPVAEATGESNIRRNLMQMLGLSVPNTTSTSTQTHRIRRSASTQTDAVQDPAGEN